MHVAEHGVGPGGLSFRDAVGAIESHVHLEAAIAQQLCSKQRDFLIVFDQENAMRGEGRRDSNLVQRRACTLIAGASRNWIG